MSGINVEPYEALAEIYDQVMSHVDYLDWVNFALAFMTDHGFPYPSNSEPISLLECGCGTGSMSLILAACGYRVTGFDRSAQMIEIALRKRESLESPPDFSVNEFTTFDSTNKFHGATCLYDSLNYLMDLKEVQRFLGNIHKALRPNGLFLFDICTELNSVAYFNGKSETGTAGSYIYKREMLYDSIERIQENRFTIHLKSQPDKTTVECHRQKIYSESEILTCVRNVGFELVEAVDGYTRNPSHDKSMRIHFLVRKV